jgi:DNA-directed RNA polymerase subunit D
MMKILKKQDDKIVLKAKMSESLANAIRRGVFEIPTNAINEVDISKNDSALYDETVAHRIGLIPLKYQKGEHKIKLKAKGQGYVYSGEIKGDVEVVFDKMPITLLKEGQEIEIKGITKEGIGKEHSKFLPGIIFYRAVSEISFDKSVVDKVKENFPDLKINERGNKASLIDEQEKSCLDFVQGICEKEKKEFEIKDTDEIIMIVESFGQLKVDDILKKSIDILKKELVEVSKKAK